MGTTAIMAAVFGLLNMPMPMPARPSQSALHAYGVFASSVSCRRAHATTTIPAAASPREPCRSAAIPASGDATSIPIASGASSSPAMIGDWPCGPWK